MARLNTTEIDAIREFIGQFGTSWENVAKAGLFEGARVLKDALIEEVNALPSIPDRYYWGARVPMSALRDAEKKSLAENVRIFKFENTKDGIVVTVGFAGENERGKPNAMIANSYVNGSSVIIKNDFVGRALRKSKSKRINAVIDKIYSIKLKDD